MSPPRTFSPPPSETSSRNERQHEHDQKDYRQDDDHYAEPPIYPPSPRSLSLGGRLSRNIYPLRPRRNAISYEKAAPLAGRRG